MLFIHLQNGFVHPPPHHHVHLLSDGGGWGWVQRSGHQRHWGHHDMVTQGRDPWLFFHFQLWERLCNCKSPSVCLSKVLIKNISRNVHILHILALATVAMQILLPLLIGVGIWCLEMFTNYTNYIIPMEEEGRADSNMSLMYLAWSFRSHDQKKSFDSVLFDPVDLSGLVE